MQVSILVFGVATVGKPTHVHHSYHGVGEGGGGTLVQVVSQGSVPSSLLGSEASLPFLHEWESPTGSDASKSDHRSGRRVGPSRKRHPPHHARVRTSKSVNPSALLHKQQKTSTKDEAVPSIPRGGVVIGSGAELSTACRMCGWMPAFVGHVVAPNTARSARLTKDLNCCHRGGSWYGKCGMKGRGLPHTYRQGWQVCNKLTNHSVDLRALPSTGRLVSQERRDTVTDKDAIQ